MADSKVIDIMLTDGSTIKIEASQIASTREQIGFQQKPFKFETMTSSITTLSRDIVESVKNIGLSKIAVKFGLEIGIESGGLTALIVKGTGKANLEITLEWSKTS
jgi:hypothetical protein